jgi:ATP-dependent DNA ligase
VPGPDDTSVVGVGTPLPTGLRPMLATAGTLPTDDDAWAYEVKWDGVRALVAVDGGRLTITSRNGNDVTSSYPELADLGRQLGSTSALLDGEVVALDPAGRTDFGRLQSRMHVARPSAALRRDTPVQLLLFDVLHLAGASLLERPYDERRAALEGLGVQGEHWSVPPAFLGGGAAVLEATRAQGLEGVVAKRRSAPYLPGRRSDDWRKLKHVHRTSAVVAGWKPGEGAAPGGSARCCSASTGRRARVRRSRRHRLHRGHASDARSAARAPALRHTRRTPPPCRGSTPAPRCGWRRRWWSRWSTPSGRATGGCGTRRTRGCATTCLLTRSSGKGRG